MRGSLVSTPTAFLSSNTGYQDALFREDKGSILRDKWLERMEEKEDNCFVGKGEGKRVFLHRSVPGTGNPPLWMTEDNNVHLLSTMAKM